MVDRYVYLEGIPDVLQISGGEPTIHPELIRMVRYAYDTPIQQVMINTGGVVIGGGAAMLGHYGGTRLTSWLLETLDPEFYYRLKIDQIDRAISNQRDAVNKLETSRH